MDTSIPPQKQCTTCLKFLPATTEYFHGEKSKRYGIGSRCKTCRRAYLQLHKEQTAASVKAYYENHKEQTLARGKQYQQTHKEQRAAISKKYRETHKEHCDAYTKKYRENSPQYRAQKKARERNRRARKRGNGGNHTGADIRKQYANQKGKCYYCKEKVGTKYHVDHVIPLAKGGSNGPENIVIACPTCNMSKKDKIIRLL